DVHQGFSSIEEGPRVAIPYIANNVAAEGSEYSDRYVMMINTLMTYAVKGLSPTQTVDFINQLRKAAYLERLSEQEDNPQFLLKDTAAAKKFNAVCKKDLFLVDTENTEAIEIIRKTLLAGTEESLEAIFEYAITKELPKVEIYDSQVCTHGQNTASMAQSIIGYSGSLDNPKMAPPGTIIQPEPGTNGKTIDLFLRQNDEVWIINPSKVNQDMDSIYTDLIAKHPEKQRIRSIIDVGSHFKGISNDTVAEMTCKFLRNENSAIQGVLSFNPHSGKLMFRHKVQPGHAIALSGTRPDIIKKETGYDPDQLFTYYDQDHITGVDISQGIDTMAVMTWSEHTKIHESLQGGRRLRELNLAQRLISAVEPGAVDKIDAKLNRPHGELPIGKVSREQLGIKELTLFGHLNESEAQREENLLFCLQKMENVLQQFILDQSFEGSKEDERILFDHAVHLFSKNLATDLYFEYAFKQETIEMETFLLRTEDQLMKPLKKILNPTDFQELDGKISTIIKEALDTLKPSMQISPLSQQTSGVSSSLNSEATMVQFREQNKDQAKDTDKAKQQDNKAVQEKLSEIDLNVFKTHKTAAEISFAKNTLKNINFGNKVQIYNSINPCISELPQIIISDDEYYANLEKNILPKEPAEAEVWSLSQVLSKDFGEGYQDLFDDHLLVSSNFAVSWAKRIDLTGNFRKESFQWLMICDENDGKKDWKLMLISVQDALDFHVMLDNAVTNNSLPKGRKIILVRPGDNIKFLRQDESFDLNEMESDPQASKLMAQAMLFAGRLQTLNRKKWSSSLDKALPKGDERKRHSKFFEEKIIRTTSEEYVSSKVYGVLNG
ncbi:MAG TPA: hypothetical protein VGP47_04305, partial [Parachlamydiaceae bacterium]|nr:hypothetical protein [Parachlamydiaceae bacterium]